jgi:photosystem II stability/assembly factor-like uncharacterized protein
MNHNIRTARKSFLFWCLLFWLAIPSQEILAQEAWQWRNPLPQGNDIMAVRFFNNNSVVAVAAFGTALRSPDGGNTWKVIYPGTPATLRSLWFVYENLGFAVGHSGAIVRTTDGGNTWAQSPLVVSSTLLSVCFSDAMVGTAVGEAGTVLRTTDGGVNWSVQNSGTVASLKGVGFSSRMNGIAVGASGLILRTTDGGVTWVQQTSGTTASLNSVLVLDNNASVAVGDGGTIIRTTNGGSSWIATGSVWAFGNLHSLRLGASSHLFALGDGGVFSSSDGGALWSKAASVSGNDLSFQNEAGVIVGQLGSILVTNDGGETWSQKRTDVTNSGTLLDVTFTSPTTVIALSRYPNEVLRSTDAGDTWSLLSTLPTDSSPLKMTFPDANRGYIIDYNTHLLRTTDGGSTWSRSDPGFNMEDIAFVDSSTGVAVGESIYRTTDTGSTWTRVGGLYLTFSSLQMVTPLFGVAALNSTGYADLVRTTDGGATWAKFDYQTSRVQSAFFSTENMGVAIATRKDGTRIIARTTDGGRTWSETIATQWGSLYDVSFSGTTRGIAVGYNAILLTTDGGDTWAQRPGGTSVTLRCVRLIDSKTAIAAGQYPSTILRSSDGGLSWTTVLTRSDYSSLIGITFPTPDIGYVGTSAELLRTTNGGLTWSSIGWPNSGNCLFFTNPLRGFVGSSSGLVKTTDGGNTWNKVSDVSSAGAISFADGNTGVVNSTSGGVYRTTDGGETWAYWSTENLTRFDAASFSGPHSGIVVGSNRVARTTDGGLTWTSQTIGTSTLKDVVMMSPQNALAVGTQVILKTSDGGMTWFPSGSGGQGGTSVSFFDTLHGTIVDGSTILTTSDGGNSWIPQRQPFKNSYGYYSSICFGDQGLGLIVGPQGTILRTTNGGVTSVSTQSPSIPVAMALEQNYPNPFNPTTVISFQVPVASHVKLTVFDMLGRVVVTLVDENKPGGVHAVQFDAAGLASGVYFYRLRTGAGTFTKKMLLVR